MNLSLKLYLNKNILFSDYIEMTYNTQIYNGYDLVNLDITQRETVGQLVGHSL